MPDEIPENPPRTPVKVPDPDPYNWTPSDWPSWSRRFQRFRRLSGLDKDDAERQVDFLIYLMGDKAEDIMKSFKFTPPEKNDDVETLIKKFTIHFGGKINVVYERARFNQRCQQAGEPVNDFITELYSMGERCNYGTMKEELIRDRIIVGITNAPLSAAMQHEENITLDKVVEKVTKAEDVTRQLPTIRNGRGDAATAQVHAAASNFKGKGKRFVKQTSNFKSKPPQDNKKPPPQSQQYPASCRKCGRTPSHPYSQCPAKNSICGRCKVKGHWTTMCRTKVSELNVPEDGDPHAEEVAFYLDRIEAKPSKILRVDITSNGKPVRWKLDCGADVPIVGDKHVDAIQPKDVLPAGIKIFLAGELPAKITGKFEVDFTWKGKVYKSWVYILPSQKEPLLSRDLALQMGLLTVAPEVLTVSQVSLPEEQYPEVFEGLGRMGEDYLIRLADGATPHAVTQSRRISVPLFEPTKKAIDELLKLDAIEEVSDPTPWCAAAVPVLKPDGSVRITVDYTELNKYVLRECQEMPTVDECLAIIGKDAKVFSKLDAKWGYWQVQLNPKCRHLTTFITPFGRFQWKRMPMGLKSAGEVYKSRKVRALQGLEGVINHVDDDLVWGRDREEHDQRLLKVLQTYKAAGITLNKNKCQFRVTECSFLGQRVSAAGIKPGESKIQDVLDMPIPKDETAVRSFLSSARHHLKFVPSLSQLLKPINDLLAGGEEMKWTAAQQKSFEEAKKALSSAQSLALFDPKLPTRVTADASGYGLGCVMEQQQRMGEWKPVHFASRVLSDVESRYAQIEKEALAATWACEKLGAYLIGLPKFELCTDHKPLVSILGDKPISELSLRLQRFRMRLVPFRYVIHHVPGKTMHAADTLSRLPSNRNAGEPDVISEIKLEEIAVAEIPSSAKMWKSIKEAQEKDSTCKLLREAILYGWPEDPQQLPVELKPFHQHSGMLNILKGTIMYAKRFFIPVEMQKSIMAKLHQGHLGVNKCRGRAYDTVWWPGISKEIAEYIDNCTICKMHRKNSPEPLLTSDTPERPWHTVGMDFAERGRRKFIVVVDYFSTYIEVAETTSTSAEAVIPKLFEIFGRHGIPAVVRSDNGPPFNSFAFSNFASICGFQHVTSSPKAPWSNGKAEAAVKEFKKILKKEPLLHLGLLALRNAPMEEGLSPSQLLMGRSLRTTLPQLEEKLLPDWPYLEKFKSQRRERQAKQELAFNARHKARPLPELSEGERIWITDHKSFATVSGQADTPRSYWVRTDEGSTLRRNRKELIHVGREESEAQLGVYQYLAILQDTLISDDQPSTTGAPPNPGPVNEGASPMKGKGRGKRRSLSPKRPGGKSAVKTGQTTRTRAIKPPVRYQDVSNWGGTAQW